MIELKDWLSIDKTSGEGNDTITLTASLLEEIGERNALIKISTATKSVYLNLKQRKLDAPVNPDDILDNELWVKSTDGSQVAPYSALFRLKVSKTRLTSDGWTLYTLKKPLTEIDEMAFYLSGVQEVVMPKTVTTIGRYAFGSCKLESLDIPDSVTTIGERAFEGNPIATLKIGSGISEIISSTFNGCKDITSIVVSENNETYDSRNNSNCIIETATNKLILGCSGTVIPNTVTVIGDRAFTDNTTNITIPNSVITIEEYAFGSTNLKSIVIPDSVTSIGEGAFTLCYELTSVTLGNGLTSIGEGAFMGCENLERIICKGKAPYIDSTTFQYVKTGGVLEYPKSYNYSSWLSSSSYYLGYYNWTGSPY